MRNIGVLVIFAGLMVSPTLLSANAPTPERTDAAAITAFNSAIDRDDHPAAARILEEVIDRHRPADGKPRHNSLIDAMSGRLLMNIPHFDQALIYLKNVKPGELAPGMRGATAVDYAEALELGGRRTEALHAFQVAQGQAETPAQRTRATLGKARMQLISDPTAAEREVASLADVGASAWQKHAIIAASRALRRDFGSAHQAADRAWTAAASAPPEDLATVRVAAIRAGLESARGDRSAEQAMIAAANGYHGRDAGMLRAQLPTCGDNGIRPDDHVTFAVAAGPSLNRRPLIPVAASRVEVVAPFFDSLAGFQLIEFDGEMGGTTITVACRTSVSPDFLARSPIDNELADWMVAQGLYPTGISNSEDDDRLVRLGRKVDELEARFGSESPLLIYPRFEFMSLLQAEAAAGRTVDPVQIVRLSKQVADGLRRAGAPEADVAALEIGSRTFAVLRNAEDIESARTQYLAMFREFLKSQPPDRVRMALRSFNRTAEDHGIKGATDQLTVDVGISLKSAFTGRERQAWLLTLADSLSDLGRSREASNLLAEARLDPGTCAALVQPPKLSGSDFSYKDYPRKLLGGSQTGSVAFDFEINADGTVAKPRPILSIPSGLFDEVSRNGIGTIRYSPAKRNGKPVACRGVVQSLNWRLEGLEEMPQAIPSPLDLDDVV